MPPSARKPAAKKPAEKADEPKPAEAGEICLPCWPDGWPTETTTGASCVHGVWTR